MENFFFRHSTHFSDMFQAFEEFYKSNAMSDVMISVEGKTIHSHRIVLSAGSDYFRRILTSIKDPNHVPVLIINDISVEDMEAMLEFLYRGQIVVTRDKVEDLRHAAYKLRIKGFENFLRKPFSTTNNGHGQGQQLSMGNQFKMPTGAHASMLNQEQYHQPQQHHNKRAMQVNEHEGKRKRASNNSKSTFDPSRITKEALLQFNRFQQEIARHRQPIVPNAHGFHSPSNGMQRNIQLEHMLKRGSIESNRSQESPSAAHMIRVKNEQSTVSITPIRHDNSELANDFCDEQEENQRNENMENGVVEKAQDLSKDAHTQALNMSNRQNGSRATNNDGDSDDDREVNYTYEMDPNSLNCWDSYADNDNENVPENPEGESEGYDEEEDYFENVSRDNQAKLEMMLNQANMLKLNGQLNPQSGFFYCEHCPKYFFDEDHLQLHIKRSHGLNKLNQCNICGKTYAWKSGLYKHKRHVHNISGKTLNQVNDNVMDGQSPSPPTTRDMLFLHNSAQDMENLKELQQDGDVKSEGTAVVTASA